MPGKAEKYIIRHGFLLGIESSYGGGGALAGTDDAILTEGPVEIRPEYLHDGERPAETGQGAPYPRARPRGRHFTGTEVTVLGRGSNAAYSATVTPEDVHVLFRISGHDAAVSTTAGSEKYTYTPTTDESAYASGVAEGYTRGQKVTGEGIYASLGIEVGDFFRVTGTLAGLMGTKPADADRPALTIAGFQPPKVEGLTVTIGNYTAARVKAIRFQQNRAIAPREDKADAGGLAGIAAGRRAPTLEIDLDAEALATSSPFHEASKIDPFELFHQGTKLAVSFTVGGVQYNRLTFSAPAAQMSGPPQPDDEEQVAVWTLPFSLHESSVGADDDYDIVAD